MLRINEDISQGQEVAVWYNDEGMYGYKSYTNGREVDLQTIGIANRDLKRNEVIDTDLELTPHSYD